jgi:hypothetical protein
MFKIFFELCYGILSINILTKISTLYIYIYIYIFMHYIYFKYSYLIIDLSIISFFFFFLPWVSLGVFDAFFRLIYKKKKLEKMCLSIYSVKL